MRKNVLSHMQILETNETLEEEKWKRLCSATHGGMDYLLNHVGPTGVLAPQFTILEMFELLQTMTGFTLTFLISKMCTMGRKDLAEETSNFYLAIPELKANAAL